MGSSISTLISTPQQLAELAYWQKVYTEIGHDAFLERRELDLRSQATYLPEIFTQRGKGLDLACGMVSVLEYLPSLNQEEGTQVTAVDALMPHYDTILRPLPRAGLCYAAMNGECLPGAWTETFDFVWHMNAIDHTPHPHALLSEVYRVLRPGGRFYLGLNFDQVVYAPYYHVWNMERVESYLMNFRLLRGTQYWEPTWNRHQFSGLYEKRA